MKPGRWGVLAHEHLCKERVNSVSRKERSILPAARPACFASSRGFACPKPLRLET